MQHLQRLAAPVTAAVLTLAALFACFAVYGIFPFGSQTLVWCDMEQQGVPLLVQLTQIVRRGEHIGYTLLDAGGMQFYGIFFFFLSNPLALTVLWTDIPADQLVGVLAAVKLSLSAMTACIWLRYRVQNLAPPFQVILGMMYGLCGYGLFYYQNLMWLDIQVMFPLLLIALQILLKKQDARPYFVCLCAMMLLCFYLCYMVVLFTLLYMAVHVRYLVPAEKRGGVLVKFWRASLLAACVTAFVWLPCFLQVMRSARGEGLLEGLLTCKLFDSFGDKLCVLGCSGMIFAAAPAVWQQVNSKSAKRDRALFLLLLIPLILDPVNTMWQTGSYQAFPLRWGMIPVLLLLTAAARQLSAHSQTHPARGIRRNSVLSAAMTAAVVIGLGCIGYFAGDRLHAYVTTLWLDLPNTLLMLPVIWLASSGYLVIIVMRQSGGISVRRAAVLLSLIFAAEFSLHASCYIGAAANDDKLFTQCIAAENPAQGDDPLLRVKLTKKYAHANMLGAMGYPTLAHYTSMTREDFLTGVNRFGYSSYWMEVPSTGGTVLSDAFWHIGRQLGARGDMPVWTTARETLGSFVLAESPYLLPSAAYLGAKPDEIAELPAGNRLEAQRFLASEIGLAADALTAYEPTALNGLTLTTDETGQTVCTLDDPDTPGEIRYSLFFPTQQALYFDLYSFRGTGFARPQDEAVSVRVNGRTVETDYPEQNHNGILYLGTADREYTVISVTVQKDFVCESYALFSIDMTQLGTALNAVQGGDVSYSGGVCTVQCSTDSPKTLLLSAAYHEGLRAEINGQPVPVYRVNSCQTAVEIPAGKCTVVIRSGVEGLRTGLLLGLLGLILLCIRLILRKKCRKGYTASEARAAVLLMRVSAGAILLLVYCFPLICSIAGLFL